MDDITVLVTGSGAPGIKGTLHSLKNNFDSRNVKTVGTDIKNNVIGKFLCDRFYQISRPSSPEYLEQLLSICKSENVDVLLPQNTSELLVLSQSKKEFGSIGTNVAVSDKESITIANDKYKLMELAKNIGVPTADFYLVNTFDELIKYATKLGWPEKPVVIKPPLSNGMRGVRIIDESIDLKVSLYSEKPTNLYLNMSFLKQILGSSFPDLLVMEYLPNDEYTVDILNSGTITVVPRKRNIIHSGISFESTVEKNELISQYSIMLAKELKLKYAFGFQFKLDENNVPKLLESNPRVQGTMVLSTFAGANIIYGAVKSALKETVPAFDIQLSTKILRYWGGIGINDTKVLGSL
ncbi:ATP-dependent carboxylate-amine ligase [Methanosarcina mazei]|uniref:ATP-dependent carboxylate-amine ligase n=1 Tax=Methanosarcina mazei TaxID=2209 RepID=A0A0F8GA70_METMZ|nr:ATP-grasp domain-containing protein [Methanosarcina mazei]KKG29105.1 ATP-dependent carboxylate-amine ligase [Methanosarcina mazei]